MNNNIIKILEDFWLTKKESKIFIFLYQYGKKPASTIARSIGDERTNTYKSLQKLVRNWFISEIVKDNTKLFFIADKNIFTHKLNSEIEEIDNKKKSLNILEKEFEELEKQSFSGKPNMVFFEWVDWIKTFYEDIITQANEKWYKIIKFFASNTLENKWANKFWEYAPDFIEKLKKKDIWVDIFLGNGVSILEEIVKSRDIEWLSELPAQNSSIQMFIFWDFVYTVIFKDIPYWIKMESEEYANIMHFLFKKIEVKK